MNEDPQEVELRIRFKFNTNYTGKHSNWQDTYNQIRGRLIWRLRDEIKHVGGSDVKIEIVN